MHSFFLQKAVSEVVAVCWELLQGRSPICCRLPCAVDVNEGFGEGFPPEARVQPW